MNLAFRLTAKWNPNKNISWETVEGLLTWPEMKEYNVRMALVVGATKKHAEVLYKKGYGTLVTRAYRLQGLSNDRLVDFFNMEQGGPQARQFVNNINIASPLYKEDIKDIAPSDFDWLYTKKVEQDLLNTSLA